jgi:hypothetical protein
MAAGESSEERRKYKRVPVEFPVTYKIRGTTILGRSVNACNEGLMVESNVALKTAFQILGILRKKRKSRLRLDFTHKKPYRTEGEIRHFHLDYSGIEPCRSLVGFFIPSLE